MNRLKTVGASLGIIALGGAIAALLVIKKRSAPTETDRSLPPLVTVIEAAPSSHQFKIRAHGTVAPGREVILAAEVAGRIVELAPSFSAGGFFQEGDVLARLDPRDHELALIRAEAALAEATVRLSREEAEAAVARSEWKAFGEGQPSPLLLREPQVAEAEAALRSARAAVEQARRNLSRTAITAPFSGRVRQKRVDLGAYVTPGAPVAEVFSVDFAEIRLPVPVDQLAFVDLPLHPDRAPAALKTPEVILSAVIAGERVEWTAAIVRTEGEIDARTRMLTAIARVENPYALGIPESRPPLAPGLFVEATLLGRTAENVFVLPRSAVHNPGAVLVVDASSRLHFRNVNVLRTERDVVVIQSGLQPGEWICVSPIEAPVDGMAVRTTAEPPSRAPQSGGLP